MTYHPFRDLWLKVVSVCLAVLLWMTVAGDPVVERGLEIPLEFENVPIGLEIAGDPPDTVSVRVRGNSRVVSRLDSAEVAAVLDLGEERPGRRLFDMFAGRVEVPSGIEITRVVPSTITLLLEREGTPRTVPVVPVIEGSPAEGMIVGRILTEPATVEVIGPETPLAELREAFTEPVSIDGATRNIDTEVTVGVADPALRLVEPVSSRVVVEIVPAPVERTLHDVSVMSRDPLDAGRVVFQPAVVTVGVRGPDGTIRDLDDDAVRVYVDLAGLRPGRYNLPVTVESSDNVRVTNIDPPSVQVSIR